jgi:hypothetical protein
MAGGLHPPLDVISSWPKPNYINPATKGRELLVVAIIFCVLAILVVSLRLWTRLCLQGHAGLDDLLITLAMVRNR